MAARTSARFQEFVAAKECYERYGAEHGLEFLGRTAEQYEHAREHPLLRQAAHGYVAAMEMSENEGQTGDAATARYQLALVRHLQGDLSEAERLLLEALRVTSALPGDHFQVLSGCHYHLGLVALKEGRLEEAVRQLLASRSIDDANRDLNGVALCDQALAACWFAGAEPEDVAARAHPEPSVVSEPDVRDEPEPPIPYAAPAVASPPDPEDSSRDDEEPEPLGGLIQYSRREVICLASYSEAANDALLPRLEDLGPAFGRPVTYIRVAFGSPDPDRATPPEMDPDQHLAAAVLILERAGLDDVDLYEFALACTARMMREPDFRLFVYLYDLTADDLRDLSEQSALAAHLFDTTHIDKRPSFGRLRSDLVRFVRSVEYLKPSAQWRQARLALERAAGHVANGVLGLAVVLALLGFPAWLLKWNLVGLSPAVPAAAALLSGLLAVPMQTPLLYALSRGRSGTMGLSGEASPLEGWVKTGLGVMLGCAALQKAVGLPLEVPWLLLGLAAGVVLDVTRRAGGRAARKLQDLTAMKERVNDAQLVQELAETLGAPAVRHFSCPILPPAAARIFISYTPSSAEGSRVAAELFRRLKGTGAAPFLDRASIPAGSNWRRSLNENVVDCDVFICILDEKSVRREWVAAEVQSTLEARRLCGAPEMIFLLHPSARREGIQALPIFHAVLSLPETAGMDRPRVIELNPQALDALVWGLAPGRYSPPAVLNPILSFPLRLALLPLFVVASLGFLLALFVALFASLEAMAKIPFTEWIVTHRLSHHVVLFSAFMLGASARYIIAAWCGTEAPVEPRPLVKAALPLVAAEGLTIALLALIPHASPLVNGWAIVLAVAGWMTAEAAPTPVRKAPSRTQVPVQAGAGP